MRQWFLHASDVPIGFGTLPPVPRQAQGPLPWLRPASLCIESPWLHQGLLSRAGAAPVVMAGNILQSAQEAAQCLPLSPQQ